MATENRLAILHDHYRESFARVVEMERSRDRLFLWVIGLFALLSLEIGYPAAIGGSFGKVSILGGELNLQALPLAALLDATWVLTLAIVLRYCQISVWVSRQYPYIHMLEGVISPALDSARLYHADGTVLVGSDVYRREGKVYLGEYPLLLDVAWFAYVILFPVILIVATGALVIWECTELSYPFLHRSFDGLIAVTLISFVFLYRVQPHVASKWRRRRTR